MPGDHGPGSHINVIGHLSAGNNYGRRTYIDAITNRNGLSLIKLAHTLLMGKECSPNSRNKRHPADCYSVLDIEVVPLCDC